jgi:carboxypeptidase family protein
MSMPRPRILLLLLAVPPLVAAGMLAYPRGDEPVSDDGTGPPPSPPATEIMGTVVGTVTTGDGQPAVGVAVLPASIDEPAQAVPEIGVLTGPAGRYEWRLHPGAYELGFYLDGEVRGTAPVAVTAGETSTVDFTLPG